MQIFKTQKKLSKHLNQIRKKNTIGFVPTMGALHSGHLSLIKASKKECDVTVCSVFINPTQFNSKKDFQKYPSNEEDDIKKLKKINCNILYIPETKDLYKKNEKTKLFDFGELTRIMEAKHREGHFNGVGTIVEKLLTIIKPQKAFFGKKDLQQLCFVKKLIKKLNISTEIIAGETIREKNGLAKSSRNILLSKKQRNEAEIIYSCLKFCKKNQELGITKLKKYTAEQINNYNEMKLEYIEFVNLDSFKKINQLEKKKINAICIAVYINNIRLIDNIIL